MDPFLISYFYRSFNLYYYDHNIAYITSLIIVKHRNPTLTSDLEVVEKQNTRVLYSFLACRSLRAPECVSIPPSSARHKTYENLR